MPTLEVLRPSQCNLWLEVLARSFQYDFYHLPAYHALAEARGEGLAHLFVYREGDDFIALPLLLRSIGQMACHKHLAEELWDATCVYGYTGPLASRPNIPPPILRNFWAVLTRTLREQQVVTVFSRLHPLIAHTELLAGLGESMVMGQTVSIDLTLPLATQRAHYRKDYKRQINKLRRMGITCRDDQDRLYLSEFIAIYHETMHRVHAHDSYFFDRAYFEHLFACLGTDLHLFVCLWADKVISAGLFTLCAGIVQGHLIGARDEYYELSPNKLLIDTVRLWANEQGAHTFHLGGGIGAKQDSLFFFKSGFSERRHDFSVWQWTLSAGAYDRLCREKNEWCQRHGLNMLFPDYFPTYRCPDCSRCLSAR